MAATFIATLFMPVAAEVGAPLPLLLNQEAMDLAVVELVATDDEHFAQHSPLPP